MAVEHRDGGGRADGAHRSPTLPDALAWPDVRSRFPGARRKVYLDTACKGIPPAEAVDAVVDYCARVRECDSRSATDDTVGFAEALADVRREAAAFVGAREHEIALVESVQQGMNAIADALRLRRGDRIVTCDLEFFPTVLPWRALAARGVELRVVPHRDGEVPLADLDAACDRRTRAVAVSSVQEVNGARLDVEGLTALCRARGVLSIVDASQHIGPAPLDVRRAPLDVVVTSGQKWLGSPFGMGFLFAREALLEELRPTLPGYMALEPREGWRAYLARTTRSSMDVLALVPDARKLEIGGTAPYAAAFALGAALRFLRDLGRERVETRVAELVALLAGELEATGVRVVTPVDPRARAGIVTFTTGDGDDDRRLYEALLDAGIVVSLRYTAGVGGIRTSPYHHSDESDVERLAGAVRRWARARATTTAGRRGK